MKPRALCLLAWLVGCNPTASPEVPTEAGPPPVAPPSAAPPPAAPTAAATTSSPQVAPSPEASATQEEALPPVDPSSPIGRLVAKLSKLPMWDNGSFPKITLPESSSTADLVAEVYRRISFDPGPVRKHRIVEEHRVRIGADPRVFTAVLTETEQGPKIVLLRYTGDSVGWWSRVMDVP